MSSPRRKVSAPHTGQEVNCPATYEHAIADAKKERAPLPVRIRVAALCSWAGLTPKHRESDTTVHRGQLTKQGSRLVRWAVVGTVRYHGSGKLAADYRTIAERRGKNKATVAIARKVLTLVYYGLRDGEIRYLAKTA